MTEVWRAAWMRAEVNLMWFRAPIACTDRQYARASAGGKAPMASRDINVVALVKGSERYVFLYDDESRAETLQTLNRYAADPKLSFSWYDASVLGQKIRQNKSHSRREGIAPRVDRRTS